MERYAQEEKIQTTDKKREKKSRSFQNTELTTPLHLKTAPYGCEWGKKNVERASKWRNASPKVADDLLAASQEGTGHLVALGVPDRWGFAVRAPHRRRSCTRVAGTTLDFVDRTTPGAGLGEFDEGAATHVALHDGLEHLVTAAGLGRRLLGAALAAGRRSGVRCKVGR